MKDHIRFFTIIATLLTVSLFSSAATAQQRFLRIPSAGGVYKLAGKVEMPATSSVYRLVIDATSDDVTATGVSRHLESAARALNLYALAAVPNDNVKVAVVVHGKATPLVLSSAAYREKFGRSNPNAALMEDLAKAGVDIVVCGQALTSQGFDVADVAKPVSVSLSAMTALVDLQGKGYALIP